MEMNEYAQEIDRVITKAGRANRSMRKRFLGPKIQEAGFAFLEQLHKECKIGATQEELEEEREQLREKQVAAVLVKPELSAEYLRSIGREDMISWD